MSKQCYRLRVCDTVVPRSRQHTAIEKPRSWKEMLEKYDEEELNELIESGAVTEVPKLHVHV